MSITTDHSPSGFGERITQGLGGKPRQQVEAARRFDERAATRRSAIEAVLKPGGLAAANSPERLARRLDRLTRYYTGEQVPVTPAQMPRIAPTELIESAIERATLAAPRPAGATTDASAAGVEVVADAAAAAPAGSDASERAGIVLERIINTADFVDVRYLEAGVAAARAVCRIDIRDDSGRTVGFGTGSLVAPRLLLTNHHVLESAEVAAASRAEFDFQDGLDGQPLTSTSFALDPGLFFLADSELDFALVAVGVGPQALELFGRNPLIEAEGKAVVGEFVTIVQHPRGHKKQVALRENRIVDLFESFLHYEADTEPGSSGSPVFNDQWEIVALHHASVPAPSHDELGGFMNEGIRASRILKFVRAQRLSTPAQALADQLFPTERITLVGAAPQGMDTETGREPTPLAAARTEAGAELDGSSAHLTFPLEITVRLGSLQAMSRVGVEPAAPQVDEEAISIDPDFANRPGYDPGFLGEGTSVPLPTLSPAQLAIASTNSLAAGADRHIFPYHHFSVGMNKERRLAFFTAVNIDGRSSHRLKRERDRWFFDPRLSEDEQIGEQVYRDNALDRGHLVRRLDPAWGESPIVAKRANDDTFHFTNCTPQHEDFNQNQTTWAGLEDYILNNAANLEFRTCVFTGPVFAEDDDDYRGVKLPRQFWKVAVMLKKDLRLSATAYLLSQEHLLAGLERLGEFSYGAYRTFQVPVTRVEAVTGLSFGSLRDSDPLAGLELAAPGREIRRPTDLRL
jgi:endonuclease G, mitochondrial